MRLRKVKNALDKLSLNKNYYIENPSDYKGKWNQVFDNDNPIHIEIGCGKGQFISKLASINPNINYVAIEKYDSVLLRCLEKVEELNLPNLRLAIIDANTLTEYFDNKEINRIQLIFDGIPDENIRTALKSKGFHWSRREGAWQREFTENTIKATNILLRDVLNKEQEQEDEEEFE